MATLYLVQQTKLFHETWRAPAYTMAPSKLSLISGLTEIPLCISFPEIVRTLFVYKLQVILRG